ncbi:conserved protein of unknown function [Candidatus Promineifilum breve]|uniref:Polymerase nucleotidyl transferase domain-containing protein n=1 Tax=Candidatus Promineifilum breve TaxID=1806508 RepID=A0A160SYD2_9CHLR|nr:hypothetical protein [Candidatus Promineifilum breve]CUS02054.2 conserved protein of unknown function [Candidatus Promineifilum breve]
MNVSRAEIEQAIVNTVSYVDAFDYPLTLAEIHRYLINLPLSPTAVYEALNRRTLVPHRLRRLGSYYMLPGRDDIVTTRRQRQTSAERLWPEAMAYGRRIARLPFVRMVGVTGSLAVSNVGPAEDIDYMIVTADDHLWVCRAFVILLVRWAARRAITLCPNYFLAEGALRLSTQNLYTAHELTQMVPLFGLPVYEAMRRLNAWTDRFLPNAQGAPALPAYVPANQPLPVLGRGSLEALFNNRPGRWLDQTEMGRKVSRFRREHPGSQEAEFSAASCKGHFNQHQQRTIQAFERLVHEQTHLESPVEEPGIRASV